MSSRSYLSAPARSAWPGRGRVTGARLAPVASSGISGSTCIVFCQFCQSLFGMRSAIGPAGGVPAADAREDLRAVGFDGHAAAAPVAALAAPQVRGDRVEIDRHAGRHAFEHRDERLPVRFAGSEKTQHTGRILYEISATSGLALAALESGVRTPVARARTRCLSVVCARRRAAARRAETASRFLQPRATTWPRTPLAAGDALCRARRWHVAGPGDRRARVDRAPGAGRGVACGVAGADSASLAAVASGARDMRGLRVGERARVVRGVRGAADRRVADRWALQAASLPAFLRAHGVTCGLSAPSTRRRRAGWYRRCRRRRSGAARHRPGFGMRLVPRPLEAHVLAALDDPRVRGPRVWNIDAVAGSGWRTSWRDSLGRRGCGVRPGAGQRARVGRAARRRPAHVVAGAARRVRPAGAARAGRVAHARSPGPGAAAGAAGRRRLDRDGRAGRRPARPAASARAHRSRRCARRTGRGAVGVAGMLVAAMAACARDCRVGQRSARRRLSRASPPGWDCAPDSPTVHERAPVFTTTPASAREPSRCRRHPGSGAGPGGGRTHRVGRAPRAARGLGVRAPARAVGRARLLVEASRLAAVRGDLPQSRRWWREAGALDAGSTRAPASSTPPRRWASSGSGRPRWWMPSTSARGAGRVARVDRAAPSSSRALLATCLCWQGRGATRCRAGEDATDPAVVLARVWPRLELRRCGRRHE